MKIVSLVPSVTETLFELGLGDSIIAITTFCCLPAEGVKTKTRVGGTKNPDREKILALKPDIILMNSEENRKEDADFFQLQGLNIHVSLPSTLEEAAGLVEDLGRQFGAAGKGAGLSAEIRSRIASLHPAHHYRSLVLIWKRPYWTVNRTTYVDAVCRAFGFVNGFGSHPERYPKLNDEEIIQADPEAVLFPDEPYVFREKDLEEFRSQFPGLAAVRQNRLFLFDGKYLTWHGYRTLVTLLEFGTKGLQ